MLRGARREATIERFRQQVEIDAHYGSPARALWSETGLNLRLADFTKLQVSGRVNFLICNPPYVRHHHLSREDKLQLREVCTSASVKLSGLAGLYCYFIVLAHRWMAPDGVAAWLIPSEFMDVNYGRTIREYLLDKVNLVRVHRFDANNVQFADALVSSAVVWFRNSPVSAGGTVQMSFGGSVTAPARAWTLPLNELRGRAKWNSVPAQQPKYRPEREEHTQICLGDLFTIKRGLATGDNRFFILAEKQVAELGIGREFLRPILPSPRHVKQGEILADRNGLPLLEPRLFLIDCPLDEERLKEADLALWRYLQSGKKTVAGGYLCRSRSPWYSQENRPPPPFLCTYMARQDAEGTRAFRFILNRSRATAANVYLLMYPKPVVARAMDDPRTAMRVFELLNAIPTQVITGEGRVYGGGLHKLEPRELANVPAEHIAEVLGASTPTRGTQLLLV